MTKCFFEHPCFRSDIAIYVQIWVNFDQNGSFLNFCQKSETVIFFRLQRLGFVQKIRKFQWALFEKNAKNLRFFGILGQKGPNWAKMGPKWAIFEFSVKKWKRHLLTHFFLFFKTKNQKIPMRGFGENLADGDDRDKGEFIGPNPPGGRRTKNGQNTD